MIEIKCSKVQKKIIIQSLLNPEGCLFPKKRKRCDSDQDADCARCFETNIKWRNQ